MISEVASVAHGRAKTAIQIIILGIALAVNRSNLCCFRFIIILGCCLCELGQFDEASRCIREAFTMIETTKELGLRPRSIAWLAKSR